MAFFQNPNMHCNFVLLTGQCPELFTLRLHGEGKFIRQLGLRVYRGGWTKYVDGCSALKFGLQRLMDIAEDCGIEGLSHFWFRSLKLA